MIKKSIISFMVILFTSSALYAQSATVQRMDVCSGLQFVMKELIAGREQTSLKGKPLPDDVTQNSCKMNFTNWQGVGVMDKPGESFSITFYKMNADEKELEGMFAQAKSDILGCALTSTPLSLTADETDHISFSVSGISVLMRLLRKTSADESTTLVMRVIKPTN